MQFAGISWAAIFAALPAVCAAQVIHVNADGSGDAPTIAAAYALDPDAIVLGPGVYYEHDIPNRAGVDLSSESDDPGDTMIDAQGESRCFANPAGTGSATTSIRGITFRNGVYDDGPASDGGGLLIGDHGVFSNCVFRDGSAQLGGAVVLHAFARFTDCLFESNEATLGAGGAIWADSSPAISDCTFRDNTAAGNGGAVFSVLVDYDDRGTLVEDSLFESNVAGGDGGAYCSTGKGDPYIFGGLEGCLLIGNRATNGGAARFQLWSVTVRSTFLDNEALEDGGAIYCNEVGLKDDNFSSSSIFVANRAGHHGGALYLTGFSYLPLSQFTFALNGAPEGAHIAGSFTGSVQFSRSIFAFGTEGGAAGPGPSIDLYCCDVFGNAGGDFVGAFEGEKGGTVFAADPLFCNLPENDVSLREGSPCLPGASPCSGAIGALSGIGCGALAVESRTWGEIKALYR